MSDCIPWVARTAGGCRNVECLSLQPSTLQKLGSIMTGEQAVVAKLFLSGNLISITDVSPSEVFALGQGVALHNGQLRVGSLGPSTKVSSDTPPSVLLLGLWASAANEESLLFAGLFPTRTLLLFGSPIMSPNIGCVSMQAFFSTKSAM